MKHRRYTVSECETISADDLAAAGVFDEQGRSVTLQAGRLAITATIETLDERTRLVLRYVLGGVSLETRVEFESLSTPWGSRRWYIRCALCGRRCGKIYRAPHAREFRCRRCAWLTYQSCRDSHKYDRLYRALGSLVGGTSADARDALESIGIHPALALALLGDDLGITSKRRQEVWQKVKRLCS